MIETRDVSFSYGRHRDGAPLVVDGVSLTIPRGTIAGLLGPNGSGKSTLVRLISGIMAPLSGGISIDGRPMATTRDWIWRGDWRSSRRRRTRRSTSPSSTWC